MVPVELFYSSTTECIHLYLEVPEGATVLEALQQSQLFFSHPEIKNLEIGIFSKIVRLDTPLKAGDRIEIYRPLTVDPKEKRRIRAKKDRKTAN